MNAVALPLQDVSPAPGLPASNPEPAAEGTPAGDPLEYLSASRLKCFQTCRLQFRFRYVDRLPTPVSPALFVGQVVHAVLQQWNLRRWRGTPFGRDILRGVFDEHWTSDQPDGIVWTEAEATSQREDAWRVLEHYVTNPPLPPEEPPEAVEVRIDGEPPASGLPPLTGILDLVRGGGRIVDYKTAARAPDTDLALLQHEVQLGCYALLYRWATGGREGGFELHHLIKTKAPKVVVTLLDPMTPEREQRLLRVMDSYVAGVLAEDYVPSPGMHCGWCNHRTACRNWTGSGS